MGIQKAIDEGVCQRKDLFIVSKLWNTFHRPEHVKLALLKTLEDLGVDYLDLYLIHYPVAQPFVPIEERYPPHWVDQTLEGAQKNRRMEIDLSVSYQETWLAMEQLVREGLVRNIGVCNVGPTMIRQVLTFATIKPAVL